MTGSIAIVLAVLVGSIVLFAIERIPVEVTALGIVLALAATRRVPARRDRRGGPCAPAPRGC